MNTDLKIFYLALSAALLPGVNVCADITSDFGLHEPGCFLFNPPGEVTGQAAVRSLRPLAFTVSGGLEPDFQFPFNPDYSRNHSGSALPKAGVRELPTGPDSAILCLYALGSIGVFHAGKSAKKLNFALIPDWYHSGGLHQTGRAQALDLDFFLVAMPPAAFFDQVAGDPPKVFSHTEWVADWFEAPFSLSPRAPRGPPGLF